MRKSPSKTGSNRRRRSRKRRPSLKKETSRAVKKQSKIRTSPQKKPTFAKRPVSLQQEKEAVETAKFTPAQPQTSEMVFAEPTPSVLPVRYGDDRIVILPRDPWWLHTYWDISERKINEVVSSIPVYERENLKWVLRTYDVTEIRDFRGDNANSFFDIDIHLEASNWYISVNNPEREWCVEIGLKNPVGKFFAVARSNITKTPYFGISSQIDEEWALSDEEYLKILGIYDLGKSSLERKKKFEEIFKQQISSPLASWGISSLFSEKVPPKDKFLLEVWTELILYGRTQANATVTVEGKKVNIKGDGTFSLRHALGLGDFTFEVIATSKNKKHKKKKTLGVKKYNK